jgi:hypothetical protein
MYLYVKFELIVYNHWGDNEQKLKINGFFSKFKRDNSVSYHQTMTKFELDQYVKFELNMYNCVWPLLDNERKLMMTEGRNGVTLYASAIFWAGARGIKMFICS